MLRCRECECIADAWIGVQQEEVCVCDFARCATASSFAEP